MPTTSIIWFRNDLRLSDNAVLTEALRKSDTVYPVYCFDPRHFSDTPLGMPKMGAFRAQFLIESVNNLRTNLRAVGSDLIVRQGIPERIIPQLAKEVQATRVIASKEVTYEEASVEEKVENLLIPMGIELELLWQSTLLHVDDIPWPINNVPDIFSQFRKEAEKTTQIRASLPAPNSLSNISAISSGDMPSLNQLGLSKPMFDA